MRQARVNIVPCPLGLRFPCRERTPPPRGRCRERPVSVWQCANVRRLTCVCALAPWVRLPGRTTRCTRVRTPSRCSTMPNARESACSPAGLSTISLSLIRLQPSPLCLDRYTVQPCCHWTSSRTKQDAARSMVAGTFVTSSCPLIAFAIGSMPFECQSPIPRHAHEAGVARQFALDAQPLRGIACSAFRLAERRKAHHEKQRGGACNHATEPGPRPDIVFCRLVHFLSLSLPSRTPYGAAQ